MPTTILSPEARLVLASAGGAAADATLDEALARPLDWAKLLTIAEREKAVPILWRRLGGRRASSVPPEVASRLQRVAMVSDFRMLHLEQRLGESLRVLGRAGIETVLLKGAALAASVYRSFPLRPMGDVDVLVPTAQAFEARDALLGAGWAWHPETASEESYRSHHHLRPMYDLRGQAVGMELHRGLYPAPHPFPRAVEEVWERRVPACVTGADTSVPHVLHQLFHLCVHFAWSNEMQDGAWRAFRDLGAIVAAGHVDWEEFTRIADAHGARTSAYWTLRLARVAADIPLPDEVVAALRPRAPERVLRVIERHFLTRLLPAENLCPSARVERAMWALGIAPRRSGHGRVRPWQHSARFEVPRPSTPPLPAWRRAGLAAERVRRLSHYLRLVLLPS